MGWQLVTLPRLQLVEQSPKQIDRLDGVQTAVFFAFTGGCSDGVKNHGMGHESFLVSWTDGLGKT